MEMKLRALLPVGKMKKRRIWESVNYISMGVE
jgi:hypothetical protein